MFSNGYDDGYVAKFDSNGNLIWAKNIGGSGWDDVDSITTDSSDNVLVGGVFILLLTLTAMEAMI